MNSSSQVQNRSRSSNCCSKANTDSGSGAAWTLCMNFSLGHPLFVFTHISITAYKRPWFVIFEEHWCCTFDTCWRFSGKLLGDLTFYDAHSVSVVFATTLLAVEPAVACSSFILSRMLGCVQMYDHVNYHVSISSHYVCQIGMHTGQYRYHWCPQQNLPQKHKVDLWMLMWIFTLKVKNKMHATQVLSSVCGSRKLCVWQT